MNKDMRTKRLFLTALCAIVCFVGYARTNIPLSTEFPGGGGGARTPVPTPTAYLDDDEIQILFSVSAPVTVTVCGKDGSCLFSKEYASTKEVTFPLAANGITEGDYVLRVFSQSLCWRGDFTVEKKKPAPSSGRNYITLEKIVLSSEDHDPLWDAVPDPTATLVEFPLSDEIHVLFDCFLDTIRVTITTENDEVLYLKDFYRTNNPRVLMNYTGIPDGEYMLNIIYHDITWKGTFVYKSHKPKGQYVYVDSTYYRLNEGYANTVWPSDYGDGKRTVTHRMLYDIFERDYPIHVVIPAELTYEGETYQVVGIGQRSFKGCYYMQSISLPNTITYIDGGAFMACKNLDHVIIPPSVTRIEDCVFAECDRLAFMVIPEGITTLENDMFHSCTNLSAVTLPSSLTRIEQWAFANCTSLPYIEIPDNVTYIGEYAFQGAALNDMKLPKNLKQIDDYAFRSCWILTSVVFPEGIKSIGKEAFSGCTKLASVTFPEGMTRIGDEAFKDMPASAHIYCNAIMPFTIGAKTFNYNCTLHVPQGCKALYEKADYWKNFKNIVEEEPSHEEVFFGGETGVTPATLSEDAARYYDLQGRPVDGTQKGILIRNGKKVIVK